MRIFVLGPIPDSKRNGGVAVFTQNLVLQLQQEGHDVVLFSKYQKPKHNLNGVEIRRLRELSMSIKKSRPQLIISSLWYSLLLIKHRNLTTVHLLHGFTNLKDYSKLKFLGMLLFDSIIRKKVNFVLANSSFTHVINEKIYNLNVDGDFQIGLPNSEISQLIQKVKKDNTVLYLGRFVKAKNVVLIENEFIRAFQDEPIKLEIVGYGTELDSITKIAEGNDRIKIVGPVQNNLVSDYFKRARVFVSLNPAEPFGITYLEALVANCFIIAPNTGGQVEILQKFPDRVKLVDIQDKFEIRNAMKYGMIQELSDFSEVYDVEKLTYKRTVDDILKVIPNE